MPNPPRAPVETVRRAVSTLAAITLLTLAGCSEADSGPATSQSPSGTIASSSPSSTLTPSPGNGAILTAVFTDHEGGEVALSIETADTPEERAIGLMNRESLPENAGMLFDFGADVRAGFWMRNTLIPLSIAFIDKGGVIVHIEDMEPQTEELHYSPSLYRYAVEVNQGWYQDNGIVVGDRVEVRAEG